MKVLKRKIDYIAQFFKFHDELIRDVLGAGGGSYWLLLTLSTLGVATGGFALILAASIFGLAFLKFLFDKKFPDFYKKHKWWKHFFHYPMLFILQVLGASGALAFMLTAVLSAAGVTLTLTTVAWITLPFLAIVSIPFIYKIYTGKDMDTHYGGAGFFLTVLGVGGASYWLLSFALPEMLTMLGISTTALSVVAFPIAIALASAALLYYGYKLCHSERYAEQHIFFQKIVPFFRSLFALKSERDETHLMKTFLGPAGKAKEELEQAKESKGSKEKSGSNTLNYDTLKRKFFIEMPKYLEKRHCKEREDSIETIKNKITELDSQQAITPITTSKYDQLKATIKTTSTAIKTDHEKHTSCRFFESQLARTLDNICEEAASSTTPSA